MRVRILLVLSAALVLSVGVANAARSTAGQQVCASYNGTYSTHVKASFFAPFSKKQKMVWACNGYTGSTAASQALMQACSNDGGQAANALDSGEATCWKNAAV
jgi:hypothetical protein